MLVQTLQHIACPGTSNISCGGLLEVRDIKSRAVFRGGFEEIAAGELECNNCGHDYPIVGGIAILVPDWRAYLVARANLLTRLPPNALPDNVLRLGLWRKPETPPTEDIEWESSEILESYLLNQFLCFNADQLDDLEDIFSSKLILDSVRSLWMNGPYFTLREHLSRLGGCSRILEIGCSVGGGLHLLEEFVHETAIGADLSLRAVAVARRMMLQIGSPLLESDRLAQAVAALSEEVTERVRCPFLDFIVADGTLPPVARRHWDVLSSINVIDVTNNPRQMAERSVDLLRTGGMIYLTAPFSIRSPLSRRLSAVKYSNESDDLVHRVITMFCEKGLQLKSIVQDLPWIIPRGPRYIELLSVDALTFSQHNISEGP
ncbi:MAG: methyltransferase domain-containing protein [Nitrospira sp.]|nr:methyltransferase domain-containing protein [Nitrospira sp.]